MHAALQLAEQPGMNVEALDEVFHLKDRAASAATVLVRLGRRIRQRQSPLSITGKRSGCGLPFIEPSIGTAESSARV